MDCQPEEAAIRDDLALSIESLIQEADNRSINELLARHGRERLFVHPLLWDHRQPALLQCRFVPAESPPPLAPPAADGDGQIPLPAPSYPVNETEKARLFEREPNLWTLLELLMARHPAILYERGSLGDPLVFSFRREPLCELGSSTRIGPMTAFITSHELSRGRSIRTPCRRVISLDIMPDPFIAAVCISLAQNQRAEQQSDDVETEDMEQSPDQDQSSRETTRTADEAQIFLAIAIGHDPVRDGRAHLSVFTANVSSAFLDKLDEPEKPPPPGRASIDIRQQRVPYRPLKTFSRRLAAAIEDARHEKLPHDGCASENYSASGERRGSSPLYRERIAASACDVETSTAETDLTRKQDSGAIGSEANPRQSQGPPEAKRRR